MIFLDVNVLVYAARREFPQHAVAASWLTRCLTGHEPVAVSEDVLASAMRLLTNHRILRAPLTSDEALDFCGRVRNAPAAIQPRTSPRRWQLFIELVSHFGLRGNDIPDALLAATSLDLGASFATFDRGFRRFPDLTVIEPSEQ